MAELDRLLEKLAKIQRLFDRASSEGERSAAKAALLRIREQIAGIPSVGIPEEPDEEPFEEPLEEYKFTLNNPWSRNLFLALLNKHGLSAFRRPGQRRTTIRARMTASFARKVLWPEFTAIDKELTSYLSEVADEIIARAINRPSPATYGRR